MQIERTGNRNDVYLFLNYLPDQPRPSDYNEVPLTALLPAFMLPHRFVVLDRLPLTAAGRTAWSTRTPFPRSDRAF